MIAKIKAAVLKFVSREDVQSVARHAVIAFVAVLVPVVVVGGFPALTVGLITAAASAAVRVVWLAVESKVTA